MGSNDETVEAIEWQEALQVGIGETPAPQQEPELS